MLAEAREPEPVALAHGRYGVAFDIRDDVDVAAVCAAVGRVELADLCEADDLAATTARVVSSEDRRALRERAERLRREAKVMRSGGGARYDGWIAPPVSR